MSGKENNSKELKEYILTKDIFYTIKSQLDGFVFWREEEGNVIVKMSSPHKKIENILINITK